MKSWNSWVVGVSRWFRPKSNGRRVSRRTAVHIRAANDARARQDWAKAANEYRLALNIAPHLDHLWVQFGHVQKETGEICGARAAYEEAIRLNPDDVEPLLHLGHMAKAWQQPAEAAAYFLRALKSDGRNLQAMSELARVMPDRGDVDPALWLSAMAVLNIPDAAAISSDAVPLPAHSVLLDVTDLLAYFGQRRLPTGIQRVQIEISLALIESGADPSPTFCLYSSARRGWVVLPTNDFRNLCLLAKASDDTDDPLWVDQLFQIYRVISATRSVTLSPGTTLINLGTSWSDRNYLLDVRTARVRAGIVYVPLVFDLIPLIEPAWFMASLVRDYRAWFRSLLHSADGYLAISKATREDLLLKAVERKAPIPDAAVRVIPLDGNFRQGTSDISALQTYGLESQAYVLFVSTLEPRKNHAGAFRAWLELASAQDDASMPHLVCVGGRGWLNDELHEILRSNPRLQKMVHILHGVPDDGLAMLYEHCLFALYPSLYEGWGLPVSEALSYGKVPAISDVSALPEAGGRFARYFDPYDVHSIAAAVQSLMDPQIRNAAEMAIKDGYSPRTWQQISQDLLGAARTIAPRALTSLPSLCGAGTWLMSLSGQDEDDAMWGEPLRHGHGWQAPTNMGCGIKGDDAALLFYWSGPANAQLNIRVGFGQDDASISATLGDFSCALTGQGIAGTLSLPLPDVHGPVRIALRTSSSELVVEKLELTVGESPGLSALPHQQ